MNSWWLTCCWGKVTANIITYAKITGFTCRVWPKPYSQSYPKLNTIYEHAVVLTGQSCVVRVLHEDWRIVIHIGHPDGEHSSGSMGGIWGCYSQMVFAPRLEVQTSDESDLATEPVDAEDPQTGSLRLAATSFWIAVCWESVSEGRVRVHVVCGNSCQHRANFGTWSKHKVKYPENAAVWSTNIFQMRSLLLCITHCFCCSIN
jgi:hypothetical protein